MSNGAPWWVLSGLVVGLMVPSFMIVYWLYRLRSVMSEKGWRYTANLWVITWIAFLLGSATGLLRILAVEEGSIIDNMLVYTSATLYYIAPVVLVVGIIIDALIRSRKV